MRLSNTDLLQVQHDLYQALNLNYDSRTLANLLYPLIKTISYLMFCQSIKSPKGAWYCTPSQIWLGTHHQKGRETANRWVSKLTKLGILNKTQRRQRRDGTWQTCLYRPGWIFSLILKKLFSLTSTPPPEKKEKKNDTPDAPNPAKPTFLNSLPP